MAEEEERHEESKHEEHKPAEEGAKSGGIGGSFAKHKTLWIVGGVGAAGVLLLLFMNSGGGSSSSSTPTSDTGTTDMNTQGAGGAVDTSSLVGSGGYPSWYNPGAAENLDYWPYVPNNNSSSGSSKSKGSSSGSSKSSGSGSSKSSGSGSSKSSGGSKGKSSSGSSKSSSGGVSHGTSHGVSSGTKTSTKKNKVTANPHAGGAHGYVYTTKAGDTLLSLQSKAWPGSKQSGASHPTSNTYIGNYANNSKILKQKGIVSKSGAIKPGTKISL